MQITKSQALNFRLMLLGRKEGGNAFAEKPERWWDDPTWRCCNNHVSKVYLKSESKNAVCLKCGEYVYLTFPEDKDGPLPEAK